MAKRKIGIFTIASKNYLAYVRVLFKSVVATHPEYSLYLCLADKVDGAFDPRAEVFQVIQSDSIGMRHFDDMTVRYDIMEFNTAVKPFMFRWLLDTTDLDSIVYLDPDIRVYSRFDRLETVLASDVSVVLTPHITRPLEDGKNPNDYHMLQAGVFNLGFIAISRSEEARRFVEWWGRRLETQACVDIARNLFTDQRWCDLAPSFLDRLHVLKCPGYNAAYWNLTERTVRQVRGHWRVNDEPLAFFHFSGISVGKEHVVSKHQDRFTWADLPDLKPLFDAYRQALLREGFEQIQSWQYAYAKTKDGIPIPTIIRHLYRETYPNSTDFSRSDITEKLRDISNGISSVVPFDSANPITRLMEIIYRRRPDLQAAFNLGTGDGRARFRVWFATAAFGEYGVPAEFIRHITPMEDKVTPLSTAGKKSGNGVHRLAAGRTPASGLGTARRRVSAPRADVPVSVSDAWGRLPISVKRFLAPVVSRMLVGATTDVMRESAMPDQLVDNPGFTPPVTGRIAALQVPAQIPQLLTGRYITELMHLIWSSRLDLRRAFDLDTPEGQSAFVGWFGAPTRREHGIGARTLAGANLIGYLHAEIGMGEHVRMSAAALQSTAVQFAVVNFNVGAPARQGERLERGEIARGNPFAANIFHVNADQMFVAYCHFGRSFFANRYNIAYWAWELPKCPPEFQPASKLVDEIWAPSRFIQQAFDEDLDVPVKYMPLCVVLPEFKRLDRAHFGMPQRAFVFLFSFDFLSFLDRKNPFGAIRAFILAFPRNCADVCLVLKVMNGNDESPLWLSMMQLIDGDPRIIIINRTMNRSEVLALLDASDCFLSLHRSEGFGRGPAEAMYLGKPVIVTNYSGNIDFTLADNSCLVDFTLIQVEKGQYPFHEGQQWADADLEHAAWYMKKLRDDGAYASDLGARGRAFIHENFNQRKIGAIYESRLKALRLI